MATYGEGDPTDNAQDFYDWLQENDDEDLSGLNYSVNIFAYGFKKKKIHDMKYYTLTIYKPLDNNWRALCVDIWVR